MRLIDADRLLHTLCSHCEDTNNCPDTLGECDDFTMLIVRHQPTVDAVPVVHAGWIQYDGGSTHYCSMCNRPSLTVGFGTNYCSYCGAKMDLDEIG